jgi:ABC-2 type transport system permease protein
MAGLVWRRLRAIYRKDMRDALRDSRVLTALVMPLALGLLYSFMFSDENVRVQKGKVGIVAAGPTQLERAIQQQVKGTYMRLTFVTFPDAAALQQKVQQKKVDVGLVVPAGFDQAVAAGQAPTLTVLYPTAPDYDTGYVRAVIDRSVAALAGRAPPATIAARTLPPETGGGTAAIDVLGARKDFILIAIILLLTMVAIYAVPAVLVEEIEKKTMEALSLIASTAEVIGAKALFGITLCVVAVPVLLAITRGRPAEYAALVAVVVLSAVVLVGIGLLYAGLLKTQQQINTWSGLVLLPLLAPAITVGMPTPAALNQALAFIPTAQSFRLLANAFAGRIIYPHEALSYAVLLVWGVGVYALLWWRLSRQEA